MTIINPFPQVPVSRNQLTPQDVARYITQPAYANEAALASAIADIQAELAAMAMITRSSVVPNTGKIDDLWVNTAEENQPYVCVLAYSAGTVDKLGCWIETGDITARGNASTALSTGTAPKTSTGAAFPSAYTQGWIFVNSNTGYSYICKETYTAALSAGARPSKFIAQVDAATAAITASVKSAVDDMGDDEKITPSEKLVLQREWSQIQDNKAAMSALATDNRLELDSDYLAAVAAFSALDTYLNTTLDIFDDLTATTDLVTEGSNRTEWNSKWTTWYGLNSTFAKTAAAAIQRNLDLGQSDETITQAEASSYKIQWTYEVANHQNHDDIVESLVDAGLVGSKASCAPWVAYDAAYSALDTYLNTTLNLFAYSGWPDVFVLSDNGSSASEWRSKWQTYTDAERAMSSTGTTTIAGTIDSFANDGSIDPQEKRTVKATWFNITGADGEYTLLTARVGDLITAGHGAELSALNATMVAAYSGLYDYLYGTLSGNSGIFDLSKNTAVDNTEWDNYWNTYFASYAVLDNTVAALSDANVGLITALVDDSKISAGKEKTRLIAQWFEFKGQVEALDARAAVGFSVSTSALHEAFSALTEYLYGVFGSSKAGFEDPELGNVHAVDPSTWKTYFQDYYDAREDLETAILETNINNLQKDSAAIPNMALDGVISPDEKVVAKVYWDAIFGTSDNGEHTNTYNQAVALLSAGDPDVVAFDNAFNQLYNYLTNDSHDPPSSFPNPIAVFSSMAVDTTLDATQQAYWHVYWNAYYTSRDVIQLRITSTLKDQVDAKLPKSGGTMTGNLAMGGNKVTGLAAATSAGQAVRYDEFNAFMSAHQAENQADFEKAWKVHESEVSGELTGAKQITSAGVVKRWNGSKWITIFAPDGFLGGSTNVLGG